MRDPIDVHNKIRRCLQKKYETWSHIRLFLSERSMSIDSLYINLSIIKPEYTEDKYEKENPLMLLGSYESIVGKKEEVKVEDLFTSRVNGNRLWVNGRAGLGKTTFCQYMAYQWSQGKLLKEFDYVFWIPLRNLRPELLPAGELSYQDVLEKRFFQGIGNRLTRDEKAELDCLLGEKKVLWILDGFDELDTRDVRIRAIWEELSTQPRCLITSRPNYEMGLGIDQRLEMIGFSNDNIQLYIEKFFAEKRLFSESLQKYLQSHLEMRGIAHVPINLEMICSMWGSERESLESTEYLTLTDLYQKLIDGLLKRVAEKEDIESVVNTNLLRRDYYQLPLKVLTILAFDGMEKGKLLFSGIELKAAIAKLGIVLTVEEKSILQKRLLELGLRTTKKDDPHYYFLHLTFQEYFAAKYLAYQISSGDLIRQQEAHLWLTHRETERRYDARFQVMLWFVAGHLATLNSAVILDNFISWLEQPPVDAIGVYLIGLLSRCVEEGKFKLSDKKIKLLLAKIEDRFNLFSSWRLCPRLMIRLNAYNSMVNSLISTFSNLTIPAYERENAVKKLGELPLGSAAITDLLKGFIYLISTRSDENLSYLVYLAFDILQKRATPTPELIASLIALIEYYKSFYNTENKPSYSSPLCGVFETFRKFQIRSVEVISTLKAFLNEDTSIFQSVFCSAARALCELGEHKQGVMSLTNWLRNTKEDSRGGFSCVFVVESLMKFEAIEEVINLIKDKDITSSDRASIIRFLNPLKNSELNKALIDVILSCIKDVDVRVQAAAVYAIGRFQFTPPEVAEILGDFLKAANKFKNNDAYYIANAAIETLRTLEITTPAILEELTTLVKDETKISSTYFNSARTEAVRALVKLGKPTSDVINALIACGTCTHGSSANHVAAIDALSEFGVKSPEIMNFLVNHLKNFSFQSGYALKALEKIGAVIDDEEIGLAAKNIISKVAGDRYSKLADLGSSNRIIKALIDVLRESKDFTVRVKIVEALGELGKKNEEIISTLLSVTQENLTSSPYKSLDNISKTFLYGMFLVPVNANLRREAIRALIKLEGQNSKVVAMLLNVLKDPRNEDENIYGLVIRTLSQVMPRHEIISILISVVNKIESTKIKKDTIFFLTQPQSFFIFFSSLTMTDLISIPSYLLPEIFKQFLQRCSDVFLWTSEGFKLNDGKSWHEAKLQAGVRPKLYALWEQVLKEQKWPQQIRVLGETVLHAAVNKGDVAEVESLVIPGEQINDQYNEKALTPLMLAVEAGHFEIVDFLCKQPDIDVYRYNNKQFTAFNLCIARNDFMMLEKLLSRYQTLDMAHFEELLSLFLAEYGEGDSSSDLKSMDQLLTQLVGAKGIADMRREEARNYLAHLHSMKGGDDETYYRAEYLEGFLVTDFLALRISHLVHVIAQVNSGKLKPPEAISVAMLFFKLKCEIRLAVNTYRLHTLNELIHGIEIIGNPEKTEMTRIRCYRQLAQSCLRQLSLLEEGEEWVCDTGNISHQVYVVFERKGAVIEIRIDNLFKPDVVSRHLLSSADHFAPYSVGRWLIEEMSSAPEPYISYLITLFTSSQVDNLEAVYRESHIFNKGEQTWVPKEWPVKLVQSVGNCVVYSYSVGSDKRLGSVLAEWLLLQETAVITDKRLLQLPSLTYVGSHLLLAAPPREPTREVTDELNEIAIQSCLVAALGIKTEQPTSHTKNENGTLHCDFTFASEEEYRGFIAYYREEREGLILHYSDYGTGGVCGVDIDPLKLVDMIDPIDSRLKAG